MTESRSTLLAAAAEEFAKHGLRGTRVQAIVARAGVNERMIYHHFGSKEGLYRAVVDAERRSMAEAWRPYLDKAATMEPYEGVRLVLQAQLDLMIARPKLVAILMHEWLAGDRTSTMPASDQLPARFRSLYERGQCHGVFAADRPFELAYTTTIGALWGLAVFLPLAADSTEEGMKASVMRDHAVEQLLDGLTGPSDD